MTCIRTCLCCFCSICYISSVGVIASPYSSNRSPDKVWHFYNGRPNIENTIKEAALGFGLDVSPSHCYAGNMAHFQIGMLAYNRVNWFKEPTLDQKQHKTMRKWIRNHFFLIAGKLVRTGGSLILKLSQNYPWQLEYRADKYRLELLQFI